MDDQQKVCILIDGGNTYSAFYKETIDLDGTVKQALLPKGAKFDYKKFCEYLAAGRTIVSIKYYIGIVRDIDHTEKSASMVSSQQKFLQKLEDMGLIIERGKIVYDHSIREKGVDVKMAIDMVIGAAENEYNSVILISSDTDLIPAIKFAQSKGKTIEYVGFSNRSSVAFLKESDMQRVFSTPDLEQFIMKK